MIKPQIIRFDSLPSTNLEAARLASEGAEEGTVIIAGEQTAGRGRLERQWSSPAGAGLYFSAILRPQFSQSLWPLLTLMAAVAVRDTLLDAYALATDIKWPNDILINQKKVCGILAETVETLSGRAVVVGIGINLKLNSFPDDLATVATSVEAAGTLTSDLETVIDTLVGYLFRYYQILQEHDGPKNIVREWSARSSYANGKRVRVANGDEILMGTSRGLETDGALRLETDSGDMKIVRTGDVTSVRASG